MTFLFKRNPKTPPEMVKALNDQAAKFDHITDANLKRNQDECSRFLKQIRGVLEGDEDTTPQPDQIALLALEIYATDCLYTMLVNMRHLDFDARKDVSCIFLALLREKSGHKSPTVEYLLHRKPEIFKILLKAPEHPDLCLELSHILRDCLKFEEITRYILESSYYWKLFDHVQLNVFEVATVAFNTLHMLLTLHKQLSLRFLDKNYEVFIAYVNKLIQSPNYVTKRQTLRLLSTLVMTRANQEFLNKYFDDPKNLRVIMLVLNDKLKNLQLQAFDILKYFVVKPKKSVRVLDVFIKNRQNFIDFFSAYDISSHQNENLVEERDFILTEITKLPSKT